MLSPRDKLRIFARNLTAVAFFNVLCALVVTYVIRNGPDFTRNLIFSMCIGMLAAFFIDGCRLLLWGEDRPSRPAFILLFSIATPAAFFLGGALARRILGLSAEEYAADSMQHVASLLILTVLASMLISYLFWNRSHVKELQARAETEKARAAAIEKQAMQAQLQMLQAQIEPHMLFNTLANLQGLIAVDPDRAQQMLDQLIQYLRATLSSSRAGQTTLEKEFTLMEAYLGLMSVRMGARLHYRLHLPADLRGAALPPMLLQPLVENAIRHGLEPKVDGGSVDVSAARDGGMLVLTVADTGLGLGSAAGTPDTAGTGLGQANIRERLLALYGESASLSIDPNPAGGILARIRLPYPAGA
jgi:signal transduction histidine kinase